MGPALSLLLSNILSCNFGCYTNFVEIASCMFVPCIFPSTNLSTDLYIFAWFALDGNVKLHFVHHFLFCYAIK